VIIYAVVSLLENEAQWIERNFLSRTHAEHVCAQLNRRRPDGHPGYVLQERDTSHPDYDGNVEC
jgi:hypothetical protein